MREQLHVADMFPNKDYKIKVVFHMSESPNKYGDILIKLGDVYKMFLRPF